MPNMSGRKKATVGGISSIIVVVLIVLAVVLSNRFPWLNNIVSLITSETATPETVEIYEEPDAGREPILTSIKNAQISIDLVVYLLTDEKVLNALADAAIRGVRVRVMVEKTPYGGGSNFEKIKKRLGAAGIDVKPGNPVFRYTHEKAMVIDGTEAWVMTCNLTNSSFERNREYLVHITDPAEVKEIEKVFSADWHRVAYAPSVKDLVWSPENAREKVEHLLKSAKESIYMEEEEFQDREILETVKAARKNGVEVKIILPQREIDRPPSETLVGELRHAGAEIRGMKAPYLHAKLIIVDGKEAMVGSTNLTPGSLDLNRELSILITRPGDVAQLAQFFDWDWEKASRESSHKVPRISPKEVGQHIGEEVIVQGKVVSIFKNKIGYFIHVGEGDFLVVIFDKDAKNFPERPDKLYKDKTIKVRGVLKIYNEFPEIVVRTPDQVEIVNGG